MKVHRPRPRPHRRTRPLLRRNSRGGTAHRPQDLHQEELLRIVLQGKEESLARK